MINLCDLEEGIWLNMLFNLKIVDDVWKYRLQTPFGEVMYLWMPQELWEFYE